MPTKATGSHPISAFVALVAGTVLSKYVWEILPPLGVASQATLTLIDNYLMAVPTDAHAAGALVVFISVTVVWEIAHLMR